MKTTKKSIERLGVVTGLMTSVLLIGYFLLMQALHLAHITELRYFNFLILLTGLLFAYRNFREPEHNIPYLPGIGLGIITTLASIFPFAGFMYAYFTYINPDFFEALKNSGTLMMGSYINPLAASGIVIAEGLASGAILSFAFMQYYKSGFELHEKGKWGVYNS